MRLTVCLEGNAEGRVLASVDMEEIVKMTITDDIEKSNFNPQMLKSCTDTSYQCGYEQGRADQKEEDNEFFNFEGAWELEKKKVRADAIDEFVESLREKLFNDGRYNIVTENDIDDVAERLKEENNDSNSKGNTH